MLISPQWKLLNIQLVNWGSFDGYHNIDLAAIAPDGKPGITMITGASGSGKSALCDSNTQVLMPANAQLKFNSASNKALNTRRGGERTLKTYVRGKVDTVHASDGSEQDRFLRPGDTAQWAAIVYTYENTSDEIFSIARFFYMKARDADNAVKTLFLTAHEKINPLLMADYAAQAFTPTVLRAVFPHATLHDGPTRFMDAVCTTLCIGGDAGALNALKLLWRVQAGYPVDDVDSLYKELVIDKPRTFGLAAKAVETFDENESVWQQLDLARRKLDVLENIEEWHDQMESSQAKAAVIEGVGKPRRDGAPFDLGTDRDATPFALWSAQRKTTMLESEHTRLCEENAHNDRRKREIEAEHGEIAREAKRVDALIAESGGARLDAIDSDIEQQRAWLAERSSMRAQYEALASVLDEQLPESREAFDSLLAHLHDRCAAARSEREGAVRQRDEAVVQASAKHEELASTQRDLEYYLAHKVNITHAMATARDVASQASGIATDELPFAAELIDMADGEERWRDAANIALHGLASTMLVDKRKLDHFSRAIDPMKAQMGMRLNFTGVDLARNYDSQATQGRISSKIVYKKGSPFIGWVKSQVNDERSDYLCVDGPEMLGGREAKITPSGQTRRGMRGAHGHGSQFRIIGFSNEALIAELRERIAKLSAEEARLQALRREADQSVAHFDELIRVIERFDELEWPRIDTASARAKLDDLLAERERLSTDEQLRALRDKRDQLALERDQKSQELGVVNEALQTGSAAIARNRKLAESADRLASGLIAQGIACTDDEHSKLDELAGDIEGFYINALDETRLRDFAERMARLVVDEHRRAVREGERARTLLARAFSTYHRDFLDSDPNYSTDPEMGYEDYRGILEELLEKRLDQPEEAWTLRLLRQTAASLVTLQEAFSAEVRTIKERLQPINQVMANYPFGPKAGTLSIVTEDRGNAAIADFKRKLAKWCEYAFVDEAPANIQREHRRLVQFMESIRADLDAGTVLDARKLVDIKVVASWPDNPERESSVFTKLGEKSGGETQELVAFILGGALLYYLGDNGERLPSYSTVFLDEAFIKADAKFTRRAIEALRGLGFQIVIAIPEDKVESISPVADKFICVTKGVDDRSRTAVLDRSR